MIKNTRRSQRASSTYERGSALSETNKARQIGAGFNALRLTDETKVRLVAEGYALPTTTLGEYHQRSDAANAVIDAGREPYLVDSEALDFGTHALIEVWDIGIETKTVGRGGRSRQTQELILTCTQRGDGLLPPDTLLVWR
jgi:hypothetical protein